MFIFFFCVCYGIRLAVLESSFFHKRSIIVEMFYRDCFLAVCFTGDEALVQCPVLEWEDTCVCRNSRS